MLPESLRDFAKLPEAIRLEWIVQGLHQILGSPPDRWTQQIKTHNERVRFMGQTQWCLNPSLSRSAPLIDLHKKLNRILHDRFPELAQQSTLRQDSESETGASINWWLWVHNLRSGHNLGSLIRTVDCMGWKGLYLSGYTPDITHKQVVEGAIGAQEWVKCERIENTEELLSQKFWALETGAGSLNLNDFEWPQEGILLVGNEELGVSPEWILRAQGIIEIEQFGRKASLNVANAFAIAAFSSRQSMRFK